MTGAPKDGPAEIPSPLSNLQAKPLKTESGNPILFLASTNPGKLREFREAAVLRNVVVEALPGFSGLSTCAEDGATFEENAHKKAIHYSRDFSGWVFADDSGLCVDALGGAPGIYSARFAGPQATDEQNNQRLMADLRPVAAKNRTAHYVCSIALAKLGQVLMVVEDRVDGIILDEARGTGGFGYDPYFFYPPYGKTLAEVSPEEKFAVSHRGKAFSKLLDGLRNIKP
jgi:XTP/dITP diphosphohydrolase